MCENNNSQGLLLATAALSTMERKWLSAMVDVVNGTTQNVFLHVFRETKNGSVSIIITLIQYFCPQPFLKKISEIHESSIQESQLFVLAEGTPGAGKLKDLKTCNKQLNVRVI